MRYLLVFMLVAVLAGCSGQPAVPAASPTTVPRPSLPPVVHYYHVVVIGDSYTEGSDEGGQGGRGWPALMAGDLRTQGVLVSPIKAAEGSAGYVATSWKGDTFGDLARKTIDRKTELVVFFGGGTDVVVAPERVGVAALEAFKSVKAAAPTAKLLVIGPVFPGPSPPEAFLNVRDAIREQAQTVGAVFVDPIAEGWLADRPELVGADQFHPTDGGHKYLADRIAPLIRNALG